MPSSVRRTRAITLPLSPSSESVDRGFWRCLSEKGDSKAALDRHRHCRCLRDWDRLRRTQAVGLSAPLFLAREKALGASSPSHPYLYILPPPTDSTIFCEEALTMKLLCGDHLSRVRRLSEADIAALEAVETPGNGQGQ